MGDYERLMRTYRELYVSSSATVLHPFPSIQATQKKKPKVRPVEEVPPPKVPEADQVGQLFQPIIQKLEEGRDALLAHLETELQKQGKTLAAGAAGKDLTQSMRDMERTMTHFMTLTLNESTWSQNNGRDPAVFLGQAQASLQEVQHEYTQALDSFLQYNLGVGQNMEEDSTLQEVQAQELILQTLLPVLAQQAGVPLEKTLLPSSVQAAKKLTKRIVRKPVSVVPTPEETQLTAVQRRNAKQAALNAAVKASVGMFQVALWTFRRLHATLPELTQFHTRLWSVAGYFSLLSESSSPGKSIDIRVRRKLARAALQKLRVEDKDVNDLRTKQLSDSSTLWNYALTRLTDFIAHEAADKVLPGLMAMMVQSSAGYLIAMMNDSSMARRATERAVEEEQRQLTAIQRMRVEEERLKQLREFHGPEALQKRREFLFQLHTNSTEAQLMEANFHSFFEKQALLEDRSKPSVEMAIQFRASQVLLNTMLNRTFHDPIPFFTAPARMRLLNSDDVLSLRNQEFYEQHKNRLNELAKVYPGELEPVRRATEKLTCVRGDSICADVDRAENLPGAAQFLETNVKFLQRTLGPKEFKRQLQQQPDADLWRESRGLAKDTILEMTGPALDKFVVLKDLHISEARDALIQGDEDTIAAIRAQFPEQLEAARLIRVKDALNTAKEEYIADTSEPIPVEALREQATSLNRDAGWEAIGNMLAQGSNNTLINNMILSILASISRTLLGFHLTDLLTGSQQFLGRILPSAVSWVPRLTTAALQYGLARHMIYLAVAHGVIGTTRVFEEWDTFMDGVLGRRPGSTAATIHNMMRWFSAGLRHTTELSISFFNYINTNSMAGWIAFAFLVGLHGFSTALWDVGVAGMGLAVAQSVVQSSNLIVLAGAEGVLHTLLQRYMSRYIKEKRGAIKRARERGASEEDLAEADAAQTALYWSPVRWAIGGTFISIAVNAARLFLLEDSNLWNNLFQSGSVELSLQPGEAAPLLSEGLQTWIRELETSLTASEDYSSRWTYNEAISLAVQAAAAQ